MNQKLSKESTLILLGLTEIDMENKYWFLLVDKKSVMIWSRFEKNKSDLKNEVMTFIKKIQSIKPISYIICDNSGENQVLKDEIDPLVLTLTFEYTPRDTNQHNGVVENKYQTLYQQMKSIINRDVI